MYIMAELVNRAPSRISIPLFPAVSRGFPRLSYQIRLECAYRRSAQHQLMVVLSVEPEVRPAVESSSPASAAAPAPSDESAVAETQPKSAVSSPEHEPHVVAAPNSSKR